MSRGSSYLALLYLGLFLLFTGAGYAYQWPFSRVDLASTFAEFRGGSFLMGVEIEDTGEAVGPIEAGRVLFLFSERPAFNGGLPGGRGNGLVLEHEGGIRSVYGYLDGSLLTLEDRRFDVGDKIAKVGDSGATPGKLLYLQIIDSEFGQAVNPLISLSAPEDSRGPEIETVRLVPADADSSRAIELGRNTRISSGSYECIVEAYDLEEDEEFFQPMAPFSLRVFLNGEEKLTVRFETIETEEETHRLLGNGEIAAKELYIDDWVYRIGTLELNPGDAMIEVAVSDFAGNETAKNFRLTVR